jgi:hypothetical protein
VQLSSARLPTSRFLAARHRYFTTDGSPVGNGFVSNSNPYAHWAHNFSDTLAAAPSKTCVFADSSGKYDQVRGAQLGCNPEAARTWVPGFTGAARLPCAVVRTCCNGQ